MRAQENIAGQFFQDAKRPFKISRHPWIDDVVDQLVAGIYVRAANDHHVVSLPFFLHLHRPRCTPARMSGRKLRNEHRAAQLHLFTIMQHLVNLRWRIEHRGVGAILKVALATRFYGWYVRIHDQILCASQPFDSVAAGVVIVVCMTDQENLYVSELEAELLHAGPNHWHTLFEITVDENMSLRRRDQITRQPLASDVIEIVRDFERRKRVSPIISL